MKILVINGPNLNMLGIREPQIYGSQTYEDLCNLIKNHCDSIGISVEFFQSNHEGALVDKIQEACGKIDGIVINPGAYTHTSVALLDAVKSVGIPTVEVHISDPDTREEFRKISYIRLACVKTIKGLGFKGYTDAVDFLVKGEYK
ncbi:MAG: type II 3-dehydroquinate dehydratase [Oscillospiraceae bacterium]|nr:type II 3-dehydroquinate dehydratase [Oscillospiraceae bacterium]